MAAKEGRSPPIHSASLNKRHSSDSSDSCELTCAQRDLLLKFVRLIQGTINKVCFEFPSTDCLSSVFF